MSAWGIGIFESDDALDWLGELADSDGTDLLQSSLSLVSADYLETPEGNSILCSAYVVGMLLGMPADNAPEELVEWISGHASLSMSDLVPSAVAGIDRVLAGDSELQELWRENEVQYPAWQEGLRRVQAYLRQKMRPIT